MPEENAAAPSFAALLRRYRRAAGLTQEQLAERARLSARAVSDLERDNSRVPRRDSVDLLIGALDLTADEQTALERAVAQSRGIAHTEQDTSSARLTPEQKPLDTLPAQLTPFIGREREIAAVRERLLDPETRLLTLTGPGGMGKTRLALQVAATVRDQFPNGVIFVGLAALTDSSLMLPTVAQALNVKEAPDRGIGETLAASLRGRRLLLVLDNFEQILPAAAGVMAMLAAAPEVKVLVTSRSALRLRGERLHLVSPLTVPTPPLPSLEALSQYEAVRLFIARARDAQPDFAVTNETAPAVAEICARLDGLPLAIELAAARIRLLDPEALLARLGERLRLATGGARDLPVRHQTLRATIDWSYDLLTTAEQELLARLAVFADGWRLEDAEAVCNAGGLPPLDVLDGLGILLDNSLVRRKMGPARFTILETIQEYARERLAVHGEPEVLPRAHALHYAELAEESMRLLRGPEQAVRLARLEVEHDNCRTALRWAAAYGDDAVLLTLSGALWRFWSIRGHWSEGLAWLERALARSSMDPSQPRARALNGAGNLALARGAYTQAQAFLDEALVAYRTIGDPEGISHVLGNLGNLTHLQGDLSRARALLEESLTLRRALGDSWSVANLLNNLGSLTQEQGQYPRARELLDEAITLYRATGDRQGAAYALGNLAELAHLQSDHQRARELFSEALPLLEELGDRGAIAVALEGAAAVASKQHQPRRAVRLFATAAALRETIGAPLSASEQESNDRGFAALRATLEDGAFAANWEAGRALSLVDAIRLARDEGPEAN